MNLKKMALSLASSVLVPALALAAPIYNPVGPQQNVSIATVTGGGWSLCFSGDYGQFTTIAGALAGCTGDRLMLAGARTDSSILQLLAQADATDVLTPTPYNGVHTANGSDWYFNGSSMGFAPVGFGISQNSADTASAPGFGSAGDDGTNRLSWHTSGNDGFGGPTNLNGGWRVGNITFLNSAPSGFTRYIFTANNAVPEPSTLLLLSGGLALAAIRLRRKA